MITVSLCMIVKDEEEVIGRCLDSLKDIVDEINIVDTGSTDRTKEIVSQYTDRIFDFKWIDDFAAARNFAFQQATKEYILWLDADDVLSAEDQDRFLNLKRTLDRSVDAVAMDYHLSFDSQGKPVDEIRRHRLAKRENNFKWEGAVHEYLGVAGNVITSDVCIQHRPLTHDASRNIGIYERRLAAGENFSPRDLYYYANELKDHQRFEEAIKFYTKFIDTNQGWVEDVIQACYKMGMCYESLGMKEKTLQSIIESFKYEAPRPHACYRLGVHFLEKQQYEPAIYWFKEAITVKDSSYFRNVAYGTWMPHLQLCVCYDRIGKHTLACEHNEMAAMYVPNHPSVEYNRKYFQGVIADEFHKIKNSIILKAEELSIRQS